MASSSSSASNSQNCPRWKYDVFLSFRGDDTRNNFTSHLHKGLESKGIFTFQDDKRLEDGDSISEELMKAIEESQVAVIIFSKNYATSSWCLDELVKIMECKEKENGHMTVIPVFCNVDASHVRYQKSESFKEAFAKHESRYKDDVVQGWRTALTAAAGLKGYVFPSSGKSDADCIKGIVDQISSKCNTSVSYLQDVVGLDTQLKKVESLLKMEINDIVRIVWIWGMGGVGKTTIAKKIFYELSSKFEVVCFLENIKENKHKIHSLQNILLSKLLGEKENCVDNKEAGRSMLSKRLLRKKVLIVLDDIDHIDQLEYLAKDLSWFGKGSRIIATTRDQHLIGENDVVHEMKTLLDRDAIKLFNQYAFKEKVPHECFKDLTLEIVSLAKGHPLALKVWGSSLHRMDITMWRSALVRIKENSGVEITKNLKISYDGLEPQEQEIFLDIACFFRGILKEEVMQVLESCYSGPKIGLHVLVNKSLLSVSENNIIEMHDLIQDMGKSIVQMQKHPEKRSRLWNVEDFKKVMDNNMGTRAMEAIWFTYSEKLCFSKNAMKNMQALRILRIFPKDNRSYRRSYFNKPDSNCQDGSIEYLSNNLRWFAWIDYPWKSLPGNFNPKRLVHLDLRWSSLHYLWKETKLSQFPYLQRINLSGSKSLKRTPDFEGMPNLKYLNLEECTSLEEVHPSLKYCEKLIELNLSYCTKLKRFSYVNVESLEYLNLQYCSSLEKFPEILGIRELPLSFFDHQPHHLNDMKNLASLPSSICKSKGLVMLDVSNCSKLESLPEEMDDLVNLEELHASYTLRLVWHKYPGKLLPENFNPGRLVHLELHCSSLHYLWNKTKLPQFPSLQRLNLSDSTSLKRTPDFEGMPNLKYLNLQGCTSLEEVHPSLKYCKKLIELNLSHCTKLERFPYVNVESLEYLYLQYCSSLEKFPEILGIRELPFSFCDHQPHHLNDMKNLASLPSSICKSKGLVMLDVSNCSKLESLPEEMGDLENLKEFYASYTQRLVWHKYPAKLLPENFNPGRLVHLELRCSSLHYLWHETKQFLSLQRIDLSHSKSLKRTPDFKGMPNLEYLNLQECTSLEEVHPSLKYCKKLIELNLYGCKSLERFPYVNVESIESLNLKYYYSLEKFPEILGIRELPFSFCDHQPHHLNDMKNLASLPSSICKSKGLVKLIVSHLSKLESLPEE